MANERLMINKLGKKFKDIQTLMKRLQALKISNFCIIFDNEKEIRQMRIKIRLTKNVFKNKFL